jgi:hypothetical protein
MNTTTMTRESAAVSERQRIVKRYVKVCDTFFQETGSIPESLYEARRVIIHELVMNITLFELIADEYPHLLKFFEKLPEGLDRDDTDDDEPDGDGPLSIDKPQAPAAGKATPSGPVCHDHMRGYQ